MGKWLQMEENMYRAFQHFDTDNSGTISQSELREALRVGHLTLLAVHSAFDGMSIAIYLAAQQLTAV